MSFIQDQTTEQPNLDVAAPGTHCPWGPGLSSSLSHENLHGKSQASSMICPHKGSFILETVGAEWLQGQRGKLLRKDRSFQPSHTERLLRTPSMCQGRDCNALQAWALGSGKTSGKFLMPTLQKEVMVPFQNRNHSCNGMGVWEEEQIRKLFCLKLHNLQCLAEI